MKIMQIRQSCQAGIYIYIYIYMTYLGKKINPKSHDEKEKEKN